MFLVAAETLAGLSSRGELEAGLLFPRFSSIRAVSVRLMGAAADFMVRSGLGCLPADFDEVVKSAGLASSASNLARWEAYAAAHWFDPAAAKL